MTVRIEIFGEGATQALAELRGLASALLPTASPLPPQPSSEPEPEPAPEPQAETVERPKRTRKPKPEPAPEPEPEEAAEPEPEPEPEPDADDEDPTVDDVKRAVRKYLGTFDDNAEGQTAAMKLLADDFEVKKVSLLTDDQYADAIAAFEKATAERED